MALLQLYSNWLHVLLTEKYVFVYVLFLFEGYVEYYFNTYRTFM